jgi:steroid delta-isomerase-like uncharacterized protein
MSKRIFVCKNVVLSWWIDGKIVVVSERALWKRRLGEEEMATTESNKAVIRSFIGAVINEDRMDRADDLVMEDFVELDPLPGQRQGREGLKEVLGTMRAAFPDMHWVAQHMVAEGDRVVTWFSWTGTHRGAFFGVPATGRGSM